MTGPVCKKRPLLLAGQHKKRFGRSGAEALVSKSVVLSGRYVMLRQFSTVDGRGETGRGEEIVTPTECEFVRPLNARSANYRLVEVSKGTLREKSFDGTEPEDVNRGTIVRRLAEVFAKRARGRMNARADRC